MCLEALLSNFWNISTLDTGGDWTNNQKKALTVLKFVLFSKENIFRIEKKMAHKIRLKEMIKFSKKSFLLELFL